MKKLSLILLPVLMLASLSAPLVARQSAPLISYITRSDSEERTPALSPDGAKLAFLRSSDNARDLELVIMDTATRQQQVPLPGMAFNSPPAWFSDSERLIASAKQPDGSYKLVEINPERREISSPLFENAPDGDQLFPDIDQRSGRILFSILTPPNLLGEPRPNFDIYVSRIDIRDVEAVISTAFRDMWPRFSPDGSGFYFFSRVGSNGRHDDIYYYDFAKEGIQRLTKNKGNDFVPAVSPDGKSLVYSSNRSGEAALYLLEMETGDTRRITPIGMRATHPVWSKNGNQVYFTARRGDGRGDIALATIDMLHFLEE